MKKLLLISLIAISSLHAEESKLSDVKGSGTNLAPMPMSTVMNLRGRFDWNHSENKTATETVKESEFQTQYLRLLADGKVTETTKFSFILNPMDTSTNGNLVETAIVTKKLTSSFSMLIGKQATMVGGNENNNADYDLFLLSNFKGALPTNTPGIAIQNEFGAQTLYVQALKSNASTGKSAYTYGATYYGNLMDGAILPIFSYHQEGTDRTGDKNKYMSLGTQFVHGNKTIEFDWSKKSEEKNGKAGKNLDITSMVVQVTHEFANYKPFIKVIMDKNENIDATVTEKERMGYEVGVRYQPTKDEDLRYHVVYNSAETKEKVGGTAKTTDSKIIAGATFSFNILK